jgi:hypothetical protein
MGSRSPLSFNADETSGRIDRDHFSEFRTSRRRAFRPIDRIPACSPAWQVMIGRSTPIDKAVPTGKLLLLSGSACRTFAIQSVGRA